MLYRVITRRLGRAGGAKERAARQRQWDRKYGQDAWAIGYLIEGVFTAQEVALDTVYYKSYVAHFESHPEDLEELIATAKHLRNPHAEATTGVDLQVPAIERYLREHGLGLEGSDVVDIGSWQGNTSHALSVRLSPLTIRCCVDERLTLEAWWQKKKCLAVWEDSER